MIGEPRTATHDENGSVSLQQLQILMVILAVTISATLMGFTFVASRSSQRLTKATDEYISLHNAAEGLMSASDYLTEMAQRFTDKGDLKYLNGYFEEAQIARRREQALETVGAYPGTEAALYQLQNALDESISLMDREYYSMKLVIEAMGYTDYPKVIDRVQLTPEDEALSPEAKMDRAQSMLLDEEYYSQKDRIRESMKNSVEELTSATKQNQTDVSDRLDRDLAIVRGIIVVQTIMFLLMTWITLRLGISPVLTAVKSIQDDSVIPMVGAREFRYLAQAYNKMYAYYHASIQRLNYKASHDALTQVYNRNGYELLLSSIDLGSTYYILIDVDNFKEVNDTLGHETGDKVLQKVASAIRQQFRSDDHVCRIGGDEFAVLMTHIDSSHKELVRAKLERIRSELSHDLDGLPAVTLSAGVVHGSTVEDTTELFERADEMLYAAKRRGRNGFVFG